MLKRVSGRSCVSVIVRLFRNDDVDLECCGCGQVGTVELEHESAVCLCVLVLTRAIRYHHHACSIVAACVCS